jgi:hypothetical protein
MSTVLEEANQKLLKKYHKKVPKKSTENKAMDAFKSRVIGLLHCLGNLLIWAQ